MTRDYLEVRYVEVFSELKIADRIATKETASLYQRNSIYVVYFEKNGELREKLFKNKKTAEMFYDSVEKAEQKQLFNYI